MATYSLSLSLRFIASRGGKKPIVPFADNRKQQTTKRWFLPFSATHPPSLPPPALAPCNHPASLRLRRCPNASLPDSSHFSLIVAGCPCQSPDCTDIVRTRRAIDMQITSWEHDTHLERSGPREQQIPVLPTPDPPLSASQTVMRKAVILPRGM